VPHVKPNNEYAPGLLPGSTHLEKFVASALAGLISTRFLPVGVPEGDSVPRKPSYVRFQVLTAASMGSSLMMEAVRTSETSVDNHFTRQYNPEDSSEQNPHTLEDLRNNITNAVQGITADVLRRVSRNMCRRVQSCLQQNEGHFQHLL
jgi:hypothetical protein